MSSQESNEEQVSIDTPDSEPLDGTSATTGKFEQESTNSTEENSTNSTEEIGSAVSSQEANEEQVSSDTVDSESLNVSSATTGRFEQESTNSTE